MKAISILFLIACLLTVLLLINHGTLVKASPAHTWTVDDNGPADFDNIQEAINYANSSDTIFVHIGTYYEHVVINKTITLIGEDTNSTIIDGSETGNVVHITKDASNVTVEGFTVRNSDTHVSSGIYVEHSMNNVIINNKVINNNEGINLASSGGNVVCNNTISSNNDGAYLYSSNNNMVSGNTISSSNYEGISLYFSSNNVLFGNTISSNPQGINLAVESQYNIIYDNNFNNTIQAESEYTNFWSYDYEGNYWSDYHKQDLNNDGIGDTPYSIDAVNKDNYPLMGMFSNFSVTLDREIYSVTVISNSTISLFGFQIGSETGNKIIHFNASNENGAIGFCRVKIPTKLMNYPHIVMVDGEEILPTALSISNETYTYLYFTYHQSHTITIISSKTLALYFELLDDYYVLNETYYALLGNYNILLSNFTQLQISFGELNNSYQTLSSLNRTYYELLGNYLKLQIDLYDLNQTYHAVSWNYSQLQTSFYELNNSYLAHLINYSALLGNYNVLLYNYTQLQLSFNDLNDSYQKHLSDYAEQIQNIRNLTYILVALTAILVITTIYLSKRAHGNITTRIKSIEEK
jgi:parallel beta-helix repeat protein